MATRHSKRTDHAGENGPCTAPSRSDGTGDVPDCASGPAYRLRWTFREILDIIRRRS